MPTENRIDCPALHKRSNSYPFGNRVPRTVRMLKTVTADPMPGIGLAYIKGNVPVANAGQSYQVWTNSHGAVAAVMPDGGHLGLRPAEFEVDTWHELSPIASEVERLTAERDALQELLTTADQRIDDLETQLAATEQSRRAWFDSSQAADKRIDDLVNALTRIHGRCEAFADDERDMKVPSVEVMRDIAARALAGTTLNFAGLPVVVDPTLSPDEVRLVQPNTPQ